MFKVGDKVVCVNSSENEGIITLGKTYTIAYVSDDLSVCNIEETPPYDWFVTRFKLESEIMDNTTPTELDPLVEIHQSEYTALIEEINLLQELLAEANQKLAEMNLQDVEEFKSVREYTMEDWEQALTGYWEFEQRDGEVINIVGLDYADTRYKVETETSWLRLDGTEYDFGYSDSDIIKRIK